MCHAKFLHYQLYQLARLMVVRALRFFWVVSPLNKQMWKVPIHYLQHSYLLQMRMVLAGWVTVVNHLICPLIYSLFTLDWCLPHCQSLRILCNAVHFTRYTLVIYMNDYWENIVMGKDPVCGIVVNDKTPTISTRYNLNSIFDNDS